MSRSAVAIGPSTGWLSAKIGVDLSLHEQVLTGSGSTAAEMVDSPERAPAMLKHPLLESNPLAFVSIHLNDFRGEAAAQQRDYVRQLMKVQRFHSASIHPDLVDQGGYKVLDQSGAPYAIENMDRQKDVGKDPSEVLDLCDTYKRRCVIDVQHAYEISRDRKAAPSTVALEMVQCAPLLGVSVSHLHVSGEVSVRGRGQVKNHASLTYATNWKEILDTLKLMYRDLPMPPPIILEGDPLRTIAYGVPEDDGQQQERIEMAIRDISKQREMVLDALKA